MVRWTLLCPVVMTLALLCGAAAVEPGAVEEMSANEATAVLVTPRPAAALPAREPARAPMRPGSPGNADRPVPAPSCTACTTPVSLHVLLTS